MLKSTTDDRWLGLRPPQPDGRWWWWFIFDFVHNLTTAPHLRTPPACFLVWPNNILNKERQCWAWCGVKQRTEKLPDCSDARSRCQWSQDPHCTVQYSTVQNSTVQDPHCLRSGVHQVHDCFSIGQTRALDSSSFALELCTKLELIKFKFILEPLFNEKMTVCLPYQVWKPLKYFCIFRNKTSLTLANQRSRGGLTAVIRTRQLGQENLSSTSAQEQIKHHAKAPSSSSPSSTSPSSIFNSVLQLWHNVHWFSN